MAASRLDLVTYSDVTAWINSSGVSATEEANIRRCITAASVYWLSKTGIGFDGAVPLKSPFVELVEYSETYDGNGNDRMFTRNRPIDSIQSLIVAGVALGASAGVNGRGYLLSNDRRSIQLRGAVFTRGCANVQLDSTAGYASTDETFLTSVPADPGPYTVQLSDDAHWLEDSGVSYFSSGDPLTKVSIAPAAGEYFLQGPGLYRFAAADAEEEMLIAFKGAGTPPDIRQAVTQMVSENYKRRSWIGQKSVSLGGQVGGTITYRDWELAPEVQSVLDYYTRTARP